MKHRPITWQERRLQLNADSRNLAVFKIFLNFLLGVSLIFIFFGILAVYEEKMITKIPDMTECSELMKYDRIRI